MTNYRMIVTFGVVVAAMGVSSFAFPPRQDRCGTLAFDGRAPVFNVRRGDGLLATWVMSACYVSERSVVHQLRWRGMDTAGDSWEGAADVGVWSASTVENGCATTNTAVEIIRGTPCRRSAVLDSTGQQVTREGLPVWEYEVRVDWPLTADKYYFGARTACEDCDAFILAGDPTDEPVYFQSDELGYSCAIDISEFLFYPIAVAFETRVSQRPKLLPRIP